MSDATYAQFYNLLGIIFLSSVTAVCWIAALVAAFFAVRLTLYNATWLLYYVRRDALGQKNVQAPARFGWRLGPGDDT